MKMPRHKPASWLDVPEGNAQASGEVVREILRYLSKHPAAKDTLEGIARWWLDRQQVERSVEEVVQSVCLLVSRGLILERRTKTGRPYYQVNLAKWAELVETLEEASGIVEYQSHPTSIRTKGGGQAREIPVAPEQDNGTEWSSGGKEC
ncbi:MAG: hypothetical protein ACM362_00175 [Candidatus Methylomirabilota bacterium]